MNNEFPVPCIKELVNDIFTGIQIICCDSSYTISDGIAMYAYANHKLETTIKSKITEIINKEFSDTM